MFTSTPSKPGCGFGEAVDADFARILERENNVLRNKLSELGEGPWLRKVLDDAKRAHAERPEWAKRPNSELKNAGPRTPDVRES